MVDRKAKDGEPRTAAADEARDLDRLLDAASHPQVPIDGPARVIAAVLAGERPTAVADNVVAVSFAPAARNRRAWLGVGEFSGLAALAAALVLGLYVGAAGLADDLIPSALASANATAGDYDIVEHVLADLEEDLG